MADLRFSIDINAPKQEVWETMLQDATYREWTAAFHEGSYYEGSWEQGATIRFVSADEDDGTTSGMLGRIAESRPYEYVSIEYVGIISRGHEDTTSPEALPWIGSHENYSFSESNGVTELEVELKGDKIESDMAAMFEGMWPKALEKLKVLVEQ